jgi:hypothetical protein
MSNRFFRTSATLLVALALAACSGGSSPLLPSSGSQQPATPARDKTAKAQIVIRWRSEREVRHSKRAFFISPSAQSIWISVAPAGKPGAATVTIVNRGKTATSTVSLNAPIGSDIFTFQACDRRDGAGNQLGGATVQQKIVAGKTNTVSATLEGYASTFAITSQDGRFSPTVGSSSGYTVAGEGQYTFGVAAVDADGNVILSPGVPKISATSDTSYFAVAPVKGKTNTYTIQALGTLNGSAGSTARPQLVLSAPGAGSITATQSYLLTDVPLLYAAGGSGSSAHIYAYDSLDNQYTLPSGAFSGLSKPAGMVYDPTNQRIYVADAGTSTILAYDESGNSLSGSGWSAPSVSGVTGIALSTNTHDIYVSSTANGGQILVFNTSGASVTTSGGFSGLHGPPVGLAYLSAANNTYVGNGSASASYLPYPANVIAVVESGNPGYYDVYDDSGTYYPSLSITLTDANTGAPFDPTGIGTGSATQTGQPPNRGQTFGNVRGSGFWITGTDSATETGASGTESSPMVALICYNANRSECFGYGGTTTFLAGNQFGGAASYFITGGDAINDISAPRSVVESPVTGDIYVINGPGGVPGGGLSGFTGAWSQYLLSVGALPIYLGKYPVTGEAALIGPPSGVSNFTAAAFTEY